MDKYEAKRLSVKTIWKDKKWVCVHCGKERELFYVATGHDHTDYSISWCPCRKEPDMLIPEQKEIAEKVSKEMYPNLPLYITVPLIERFLAALPPAVQQGWKLVPVEPTPEMMAAMQSSGWMPGNYAAMLAAAPEYKPAPQPADDVVRDAERYRWLRSEHAINDPMAAVVWKRNYDRKESEWVNTSDVRSLDAAIDAAMAKEKA